MGCLTVPNDWREPDFTTLRDAHQLHLRRQRRPNAEFALTPPAEMEHRFRRYPEAIAATVTNRACRLA